MTDQEPAAVVRQLVAGFQGTHLVYVMAELGIADLLLEGPRSSDELASLLHADPGALHRVLRALAHLGLLEQGNAGGFTLTPQGDTLRSDRPGSLRPLARFWGHQMMQEAWSNLLYSVRTGEPAFDRVFGMPVFAYLEANPDAAAIYHDSMARMRAAATAAAVAAYDFGSFGTIVDVGGGNGSLLIEILRAYPQPRGIVFDLPNARAEAEELLVAAGLGSRAQFDAGDFFASVTAGADCYLLRQVLHDWDDAKAEMILRSCREAITPNGTLLLIELLLPEAGNLGKEEVMVDVTMLVRVGGRERTEAEYRALLERTGFRLDRVVPTLSSHNILECTPV